jgi:hypothetical protein
MDNRMPYYPNASKADEVTCVFRDSNESLDEQVMMNHGIKNHDPIFYPFKHSVHLTQL